jgi:hypothetical protein
VRESRASSPRDVAEIYILVDPRDRSIRYVGVTIRGTSSRIAAHLNDAGKVGYNRLKSEWLRSLRDEGLSPEVFVVEVANASDRYEIEKRWIRAFTEIGAPLVNGAPGKNGP